jgi:hypothetical protein
MTIEELLTDLTDSGWTVSWAFQYAPNEWRCTIIRTCDWNGYDQPDHYVAHCAFAPTFAEALEDAMCKRNDAEFIEGNKLEYALEPNKSLVDLLGLIHKPLAPAASIKRRF